MSSHPTAGTTQPRVAALAHGLMASFTLPLQVPSTAVAIHEGTTIHGYLNAVPGHASILGQIYSLPPLLSHLTYAPVYTSNGALAHMPLGPMHATLPKPCN
ncbi:unnamed protein product [Prunus armeniaca]